MKRALDTNTVTIQQESCNTMKFLPTLLATALLLSAQVAQAKPPKHKAPAVVETVDAPTKDTFSCTITELKIVGVLNPRGWMDYNALVRMGCKNTGPKTVRIRVADVFLEDEEYEYDHSNDIETFNAFYENEPGVTFARRYVDTAPGKTSDFVISFENVNSKWGVGLVLDMNGTKHPLPVLPH